MTTNKYSKGKIYKLVNSVNDKIYIGSTTCTLAQRKAGHKTDAKRALKRPVCKHFNEIGWTNVEIVLLENYACNSLEELTARERKWIDKLKPVLNITLPGRTEAQYIADMKKINKEKTRKRKEAQQKKQTEKQCLQDALKKIQTEKKCIQDALKKIQTEKKYIQDAHKIETKPNKIETKPLPFKNQMEESVVKIACSKYKGKDNYLEKIKKATKQYRDNVDKKTRVDITENNTVIFRDKKEELFVKCVCSQYNGKVNYIEYVVKATKRYRELEKEKRDTKVLEYLRQQGIRV